MTGERCLFWVQSLLGTGHLRRALTLAGALARDGLEVTLANGGPPAAFPTPPGVRLVQLPPVRSPTAARGAPASSSSPPSATCWSASATPPGTPARSRPSTPTTTPSWFTATRP